MIQFTIDLNEIDAAIFIRAAGHSPYTTEEYLTDVLHMVITQAYLMKEVPVKLYPNEQ